MNVFWIGSLRFIRAGEALRLARWARMRDGFWLGLQARHDLEMTEWTVKPRQPGSSNRSTRWPPHRENRLHKGQGRPVSRILLYPAIHLREIPGLPSGKLRLPVRAVHEPLYGQFGLLAPVVYLAGPSPRDAAGGLLPHPFTHHL